MHPKPLGTRRTLPRAAVLACLLALALFPRCESVDAPLPAGGGDLYEADPAFPDSSDSSEVQPQNPLPGFDDPTQPHP